MDLEYRPTRVSLRAFLITIGVVAVLGLIVFVSPIPDSIPNSDTLKIELIAGIGIAALIYLLQLKNSKEIENTITKINSATTEIREIAEKQDSLYRSITLNALALIHGLFSLTERDLKANLKQAEELKNNPQSQLNYINELLSYRSEQNSIHLHTVKTIDKELGFIRPFISSDLYYEIRGIWGRIKALTGTADFNFPFESSGVESWIGICKSALDEMNKTNPKILQILSDENEKQVKT